MNELKILLQNNLNIEFRTAVLSNPRQKDVAEKIKVRPLLKKDKLIFQIETFRNHQRSEEHTSELQSLSC